MKVTSPYCEILKIRAWQAILLSPPIKCDSAFLSGIFPDRKTHSLVLYTLCIKKEPYMDGS
jgi:hypothetical protein